MSAIAIVQAETGDTTAAKASIADALAAADNIESSMSQARVLSSIAEAQVKGGDSVAAKTTISNALAITNRTDSLWRSSLFRDIAIAQANVRDIAAALDTAREIGRADGADRVLALISIAETQARAGDTTAAKTTVLEALSTTREIGEAPSRALALAAVAWFQARAGDLDPAKTIAAEALTVARGIDQAYDRAFVLPNVLVMLDTGRMNTI